MGDELMGEGVNSLLSLLSLKDGVSLELLHVNRWQSIKTF